VALTDAVLVITHARTRTHAERSTSWRERTSRHTISSKTRSSSYRQTAPAPAASPTANACSARPCLRSRPPQALLHHPLPNVPYLARELTRLQRQRQRQRQARPSIGTLLWPSESKKMPVPLDNNCQSQRMRVSDRRLMAPPWCVSLPFERLVAFLSPSLTHPLFLPLQPMAGSHRQRRVRCAASA
jgi:hypothetical protein